MAGPRCASRPPRAVPFVRPWKERARAHGAQSCTPSTLARRRPAARWQGPKIAGFPIGDSAPGGLLLRPVVGFRVGAGLTDDDQVTIRSSSERLRRGWPQQESDQSRERDLRGLIAARAAVTRSLDASHASNRMRLASFRLLHSPRQAAGVLLPAAS